MDIVSTEWLIEKCIDRSKHDDSWQKYVITDCYCCEYAAGWGLVNRLCSHHLTIKQEEIHPAITRCGFMIIFWIHLTEFFHGCKAENIDGEMSNNFIVT
jgi:hypothetical protein